MFDDCLCGGNLAPLSSTHRISVALSGSLGVNFISTRSSPIYRANHNPGSLIIHSGAPYGLHRALLICINVEGDAACDGFAPPAAGFLRRVLINTGFAYMRVNYLDGGGPRGCFSSVFDKHQTQKRIVFTLHTPSFRRLDGALDRGI